MRYIWNNLNKISFETFTKYMYASYLGNRDDYYSFFDENNKNILNYIKYETKSHKIYVNCNEIHLEYLLDLNNIQNANEESVSRLRLLCRALPIYEFYCSDAIKPSLNLLSDYEIPDDAHKKMPIENVIITFHQEINKLWNDTILSNYEFETVEEWIEYWENLRKIICNLFEKGSTLIDKILGKKNIKITNNEYHKLINQYQILLMNERGYPKENKPFEKIKLSPKEISKIKNNYFNIVENIISFFINFLIKENAEQKRLFLLNLRKIQSNYIEMQRYFKKNNWISNETDNVKLCLWEKEIINKFAMYCHYYDSHEPNSRYTKYDVKKWYEDILIKESEEIQEKLKTLSEIFHVYFPREPYYKDILSYYPIIIEGFNFLSSGNLEEFFKRSLSFANSKYDYLILLTADANHIVSQVSMRFPKNIFKDGSGQSFPEKTTIQMLECFDKKFEIEVVDSSNENKLDISFLAQRLWQYSKVMRILVDEEDKDYLTHNLMILRKDITKILLEIKNDIPFENIDSLQNICNKVFAGEEFNDYSFNKMINDEIERSMKK